MDSNSTHFDLVYQGKAYSVMTNLVATYNIYNLLAAIAALHESGVSMDTILSACSHLPQVEGRLEQIKEGQSFNVIVDFAHTPDGMEK